MPRNIKHNTSLSLCLPSSAPPPSPLPPSSPPPSSLQLAASLVRAAPLHYSKQHYCTFKQPSPLQFTIADRRDVTPLPHPKQMHATTPSFIIGSAHYFMIADRREISLAIASATTSGLSS